ncbi:MAG: site-specific DNA-methyltransferase [Candidatus Kuenenia sp.]|nr:site-specific DNA-methyltransferase [Candidatus Kuenenia hertensis]
MDNVFYVEISLVVTRLKMIRLEMLKKVDWDFAEASTNTATNAIHPYPAKFIPQIPYHFINELTLPGETVYDPFLGSGTTAVEANILGRNAIGNDVNELAVLISKVKTTPISIQRLDFLNSFLDRIRKRIDRYYKGKESEISPPDIINLNLWFKDFVIAELVVIKEEIENLSYQDLKDFCLVGLSGVIINVSNQDSDTRYVRVSKNINHEDTFIKFAKQTNKLIRIMSGCYKQLENGHSFFKVADTRKEGIFGEYSADLVITSPPYPNAYDYHLYHKYRLLWLGMNPYSLKKSEIGAHADYSKNNGMTEFDFQKDMEKCFLNTSSILKRRKYFVVVIGDSILKGQNIRNNEILKQAAQNTPFSFVAEFTKNLNLRKKSLNSKKKYKNYLWD